MIFRRSMFIHSFIVHMNCIDLFTFIMLGEQIQKQIFLKCSYDVENKTLKGQL